MHISAEEWDRLLHQNSMTATSSNSSCSDSQVCAAMCVCVCVWAAVNGELSSAMLPVSSPSLALNGARTGLQEGHCFEGGAEGQGYPWLIRALRGVCVIYVWCLNLSPVSLAVSEYEDSCFAEQSVTAFLHWSMKMVSDGLARRSSVTWNDLEEI